jgi:hypothetical protein
MNKHGLLILKITILLSVSPLLHAQSAYEDDIRDFDKTTGIGCISKEPQTKEAEFYFICKSKRSADAAWNAALYRGKLACKGKNFSVFFNINPTIPVQENIYGAQVELSCK